MNATPRATTNEATAVPIVPKLSAIPVCGNSAFLASFCFVDSSCLGASLAGSVFSSRDALAVSAVVLGEIFASLAVGLEASD